MKYKNKRCELCGSLIDPSDTFCKVCGNVKVKDKDAPDAIIEEREGAKKAFKVNNNYIYIVLGILAIVLVYFLIS